jgi:hypothetical protein
MLTGAQLATAITAVLVAAILLGWILHWIWSRLAGPRGDGARLAELTTRLHEAEHARQAADDARLSAETLLAAREVELEARAEDLQGRYDALVLSRDAEFTAIQREAQADAEAAMSGLRIARRQIAELEAELEALRRDEGV